MCFLALSMLTITIPCAGDELNYSNRTFTRALEMSAEDWVDPAEMERTWQAALVRIPTGKEIIATRLAELDPTPLPAGKRLPTVVYLHGCTGIWPGTYARIDFLAKSGFAVIAPVSLARIRYPKSCDPVQKAGGFYRATLRMRQADAGHAIVKAKQLGWVDPDNVFLVGFSQGGITAATFESDTDTAVNARVVEGWTCRADWGEYHGVNAPDSEPVLTLVAEGDPWFQNPWSRGDCEMFLDAENGSLSIVYTEAALREQHGLLGEAGVQATVVDFLRHNIRK
jgi:dienelactone hydrolase